MAAGITAKASTVSKTVTRVRYRMASAPCARPVPRRIDASGQAPRPRADTFELTRRPGFAPTKVSAGEKRIDNSGNYVRLLVKRVVHHLR